MKRRKQVIGDRGDGDTPPEVEVAAAIHMYRRKRNPFICRTETSNQHQSTTTVDFAEGETE